MGKAEEMYQKLQELMELADEINSSGEYSTEEILQELADHFDVAITIA